MNVRIIAMRIPDAFFTNAGGNTKRAELDVSIGPISIYGCALVETHDGRAVVRPPLRKVRGEKSGFNIRDAEIRGELIRAATEAYEGISGQPFAA